jgi:hypothetical protein
MIYGIPEQSGLGVYEGVKAGDGFTVTFMEVLFWPQGFETV